MRSIWKGHIRFSLVTIPIRVYNAVDTTQTIRLNQLHKDCHGPVGYDKRCKKCNSILSQDEIVKGYQYEPDKYVVIDPEDMDKIRLKTTRIVEVEGFISEKEVPTTLYDSPYFVGPDGPVAAKAYHLLLNALKESRKVGIGKIVLRDHEDVVLIAPHKSGMLLHRLRDPKEMRDIREVPQIDGADQVDENALKLANNLVETMTTSLGDIDFTDRYKDALREMIANKLEGKEVVSFVEEERPVVDIMTALRESIDQAKTQRKPMVKATGKQKKAAAVEAVAEKKPRKRKTS